jgi:hypothetical protein
MANENKNTLANIKLLQALLDFIASLDQYIVWYTTEASECGLCRGGNELICTAPSFTRIYEQDVPRVNPDEVWPVRMKQIEYAFRLYLETAEFSTNVCVRDLYRNLESLICVWRETVNESDLAEELDDVFGGAIMLEETQSNGLKRHIDGGFDPSDICGDVIVLYDSLLYLLNDELIEMCGGQQLLLDGVLKARLKELNEEKTKE